MFGCACSPPSRFCYHCNPSPCFFDPCLVCLCLSDCLLACLRACLRACLPACLPACLSSLCSPSPFSHFLAFPQTFTRSLDNGRKKTTYIPGTNCGWDKKKTNKKQNKTKQQQQQQRAPPLKASCGQASPRHDKAHARGGLVPVPAGHSAVTSCVHARELRVRGGGGDVGHEAALFPAQSGGVRLLGGNIHREFLFCFVLFVCTPFASWPTYSSTTPFGNIRTDYTLI